MARKTGAEKWRQKMKSIYGASFGSVFHGTYRGDTRSRNLYQKLALMHVTKIVRFDWSAVIESFWYKKLARNRAALYSVQVSATSFLSVCHCYYSCKRERKLECK